MKRRTFVSLAGLMALGFPLSGSARVTLDSPATKTKRERNIKVIGIGGCGGAAVDHMIDKKLDYVEFACVDTDLLALQKTKGQGNCSSALPQPRGVGLGQIRKWDGRLL